MQRITITIDDGLVQDIDHLQREIDRLAEENNGLRDRRADPAGAERRAERGRKFQMPSEEDVDRALSYMQRMMRLFKDKMRELESDKDPRRL